LTSANGMVTLTASGMLMITAAGSINADGAVSLTGTGGIFTAGTITTTDDPIQFANAVMLTGDVALSAGMGSVTFSGTVDASLTTPYSLAINSASTVEFDDAVGGICPLANLMVNASSSATFAA